MNTRSIICNSRILSHAYYTTESALSYAVDHHLQEEELTLQTIPKDWNQKHATAEAGTSDDSAFSRTTVGPSDAWPSCTLSAVGLHRLPLKRHHQSARSNRAGEFNL